MRSLSQRCGLQADVLQRVRDDAFAAILVPLDRFINALFQAERGFAESLHGAIHWGDVIARHTAKTPGCNGERNMNGLQEIATECDGPNEPGRYVTHWCAGKSARDGIHPNPEIHRLIAYIEHFAIENIAARELDENPRGRLAILAFAVTDDMGVGDDVTGVVEDESGAFCRCAPASNAAIV